MIWELRINYCISPKLKITLRYEYSGGQKMHLSLKGRNYDIFHCTDRTVKIQKKKLHRNCVICPEFVCLCPKCPNGWMNQANFFIVTHMSPGKDYGLSELNVLPRKQCWTLNFHWNPTAIFSVFQYSCLKK